jgi:hypothetical protein
MIQLFNTFKEAMDFIQHTPKRCKCRFVAKIAKWVVTITTAYTIYALATI